MDRVRLRALGEAIALCTFSLPASAQGPLHTLKGGGAPGKGLGHSVAAAGDVNGDGFADLIVGYRTGSIAAGANAGSARVYSGLDGAVLYTFIGDGAGDMLGRAVAGVGDIDSDGFDDVIVGAQMDDNNGVDSGTARIYSGRDGSVIYAVHGSAVKDQLGVSVCGPGDVDGDGRVDFAVGANPTPTGSAKAGYVRVYSGATGAVLYQLTGAMNTSRLGFSLAAAGDTNGDGRPDLVIGDPRHLQVVNAAGAVFVISGPTGAQLFRFVGTASNDQLGTSVGGAGDVDGDGMMDVISGTPWVDKGTVPDVGVARVWSGRTGIMLYEMRGDAQLDFFGGAVAGAGDIDSDGYADFLVGAYGDDNTAPQSGSARVYSGRDGTILCSFDGDSSADEFGYSVCAVGDVNGDGGADFAIGAPVDDAGGGMGSGTVRVYGGAPPPLTSGSSNYCYPVVASDRQLAIMSHGGSLSVAANDLVLRVNGAPPSSSGVFMIGDSPAQVPFLSGTLCLGGVVKRVPPTVLVNSTGMGQVAIDYQGRPRLLSEIRPGAVWYFQFMYVDPSAPPCCSTGLSDGLAITFGP